MGMSLSTPPHSRTPRESSELLSLLTPSLSSSHPKQNITAEGIVTNGFHSAKP